MRGGGCHGRIRAHGARRALFRLAIPLVVVLALWGAPSAQAATLVRCESGGFRDHYCAVETHGGVRLVRQLSRAPCRQGSSWSYDRHGIWVNDGCGGEFEIMPGPRDRGAARSHAPKQYARGGEEIACESREYRYQYCPVRNAREVELLRQTSSSNCRFNRSWGYDRGGIWVDQGCAAIFRVRW